MMQSSMTPLSNPANTVKWLYTYKNCMGPGSFEYSKKVGNAYMARYATVKRLGHTPTDEDFARIHNGGPSGWKNSATLGYWHKVQAALNSLQ